MESKQEDRPFFELLFEEADLLLAKAEQAGPDNEDRSYVAATFHRLTEEWLKRAAPDALSNCDIGAIAQTAEEFFKKRNPFLGQVPMAYLMSHLLAVCLQQAFKEEGRKVEFSVFDYAEIPDPSDEELEDYKSGYDPLALYKFAQRVITRGGLRVRGDDSEIFRAILELNEAQFVVVSTREEFAESLACLPDKIRDERLAEFDNLLSAQPKQTPDIIANLLRDVRARLIRDYTAATFQGFWSLGDHSIRCGVIATLFLAAQYANAVNAEAAGMSEDVVEKLRPRLTDLKKEVAAFFADWLT
jgi:hypothetical protein